ncbi:MAG: glycosyltransferase [Clostridia bacterium]|nr:glycosyltransferase [Clostridia bacterium]
MRIFICADIHFPRGDAGANRIQYVAKAIMAAGQDVVIISCGRKDGELNKDGFFYYDGIKYKNITVGNNKILKILNKKIFSGKSVLNILKQFNPSEKDIIYIYGSNSLFVYPIMKYAERKNICSYIEVVEWHQPYQYKYGSVNPGYISSNKTFESLAPRIGNVLAISEKIADYYKEKKCNVDVFPVFIDTDSQFINSDFLDEKYVHLVYPGKPQTKDNIATMIKAMLLLPREELDRCVFHITGTTESAICEALGNERDLLDALGEHIIFHGWMEYDELVDLYQKMDFLYMCRFNNEVSQANFPSKLPELMAWGIAPICNKVGDYYRYLEDGKNAFIFDNDSVDDCVSALKRALKLSEEEKMIMKRNARQCAIDHFDYRSWQKKLTDFLRLS